MFCYKDKTFCIGMNFKKCVSCVDLLREHDKINAKQFNIPLAATIYKCKKVRRK